MAKSSDYVKHIESFVVSSTSPTQQVESINAIASLLKEDMLTFEALVREMEMYLTTTDSTIRGRGILLLAELMTCLVSKPLENSTIHSLLGFFTERLADWRVLHGALVGCLALLKRKGNVGMVGGTEALAAAQSYFQNVQVQSLGHRDRKVCFELLKCLLDRYPDDILPLGDVLIFGICESIDGEKDPQCLMLAFHVVEVLVRLFPDPSSPLESYAMDMFENLSCYFPVHFTHPNGEDADVKKDDLSKALMERKSPIMQPAHLSLLKNLAQTFKQDFNQTMVFGSTPLFEPFAIPLLLEKLSSSLPSAKVESLKYLSHCTEKYGADRMAKHVEALWSALKDALYTSVHADLPLELELLDGTSFQDNEIVTEALVLLHKVISQSNSVLLDLIVSDKDVNTTMDTIHSCKDYNNIPMQIKQRLHVVGRVLSVSARASMYSCNKVFGSFFPRIMDALATSDQNADKDIVISDRCNFAAIYLCTELLAASRALVVGSDEFITPNVTDHETWCDMLYSFSSSLTKGFICTLATEIDTKNSDAYLHYGVRGLQLLATYPGKISAVSKSIYESILVQLMAIITLKFNKTSLWKLSLKALVEVGSFVHKSQDFEKAQSFGAIVVEKVASLMVCDEIHMPPSLKVEVISRIGMTGLNYMLRILEGLDKTLSSCLSEVYVHGDVKITDTTVSLLECYSDKVLPWFESIGGFEEVPLRLAVNIWDQIEASTSFSIDIQKEKLLPVAMMAMKHAVTICSEEGQSIIIHKAFSILSSSTSLLAGESRSETIVVTVESSHCGGFSCRDDWIISLYASVIIALRPKTHITNLKVIMQLFLTTHLSGHIPSAQALGSLINKIPVKVDDVDASEGCSLEEAIVMIFSSRGWSLCNIDPIPKCSPAVYDNEMIPEMLISGKISPLLQRHAIIGLAWIGKGLLMRGHEKVKDIILTFLNCLLPWKQKDSADQELLNLMRSAADAFNTLISDSETCLSRRFHATMRPLYKQRLFSIVSPILLSSLVKADSTFSREMLYRAFANIVSNTPLSAMLSEAKKLIPVLLDGLFKLSEDKQNKNILYNVLLVLSGIITDKTGQEAVIENINVAIGRLIELISYPHMMLIRETAIECLVAMSELPYARIYPMRIQVLVSLSKALDDPKRAVRQEAVRCIQAWASIAPRTLHF